MAFSLYVAVLFVLLRETAADVTLQVGASQSHPMEGHSTSLTCKAHRMNQSHVIIWNKDQRSITWGDTMGQIMSSRFELIINSDDNRNLTIYTLNINDVTRDDDGRYQCQVLQVNGDGYSAMASESVIISVLYFPADGYPHCFLNGSQTLLTDSLLTVSCTSEVGNPQISSVWSAGDPDNPTPTVYDVVTSSNIIVSKLELQVTTDLNNATYICLVTSPAFAGVSRTCSVGPLRILEWPIVTITRSVTRVAEGSDIHFVCTIEPMMQTLQWNTSRDIDPARLVISDHGSTLTVKNVKPQDNTTYVTCYVTYKNRLIEAVSVLLLAPSTVNNMWIVPTPPAFHATSDLCLPWFGSFLFVAGVNVILCIIVARLLFQFKRLSSEKKNAPDTADIEIDNDMKTKIQDTVVSWQSDLSNWAIAPEKLLKKQRRESWKSFSQDEHTLQAPVMEKGFPATYMSLDQSVTSKLKKSASLPKLYLDDSDSYVTPTSQVHPLRTTNTSLPAIKYSQSSIKMRETPSNGVESVRANLDETNGQSPDSVYQALRKTCKKPQSKKSKPHVSPSTKKPLPENVAGIVGEDFASTSYSDPGKRPKSPIDEGACYMSTGSLLNKESTRIKINRPSTLKESDIQPDVTHNHPSHGNSLESSTDIGSPMYLENTGGQRLRASASPSSSVQSTNADIVPKKLDTPGDCWSSAKKAPVINSLEPPNQSAYDNYGADLSSSESNSYQAADSFDRRHSTMTGPQLATRSISPHPSEASYLELGDAYGEIQGYMDMTKSNRSQLAVPRRIDADKASISSGENYEVMEEEGRNYEYSIPPK